MVLGLRIRVSEVGCRMNRLKVQVEGEELRSEASGTPGRKKYKLEFLIGSFKNKSIKVWFSKAQGKHMRRQKKPEVHKHYWV